MRLVEEFIESVFAWQSDASSEVNTCRLLGRGLYFFFDALSTVREIVNLQRVLNQRWGFLASLPDSSLEDLRDLFVVLDASCEACDKMLKGFKEAFDEWKALLERDEVRLDAELDAVLKARGATPYLHFLMFDIQIRHYQIHDYETLIADYQASVNTLKTLREEVKKALKKETVSVACLAL